MPLSLFDRRNLLVACDPRYGSVLYFSYTSMSTDSLFGALRRYLTAGTIFRGKVESLEVSPLPTLFDLLLERQRSAGRGLCIHMHPYILKEKIIFSAVTYSKPYINSK